LESTAWKKLAQPRRNYRYLLRWLGFLGILTLLAAPFLLPVSHAKAATPLQTKTTITITYPKRGTIITSSSVQISVSYLWEAYSWDPPSPTNKWGVRITCRLYQSFDRSKNESDYRQFEYVGDVTSTSGSASLTVNLANYPSGMYEVSADLLGPVYGSSKIGPWTSDVTDFQYGYQTKTTSGSSGNTAVVPPVNPQPNSSSGGGAGLIVGVAAGIGAIGGGIFLIKKLTGGGKTPPQKTIVNTGGGNKTTPPTRPNTDKTTPPAGPRRPQTNKAISDAADALSKAKKNAALFEKWTNLRNSVASDPELSDFVNKARNSIIGSNGEVNEKNLNHLQSLLKNWINRDKLHQSADYDNTDAMKDTLNQWQGFSNNFWVRAGFAVASGGLSELVFIPVSSVSTMGQGILSGRSTGDSVAIGLLQATQQMAMMKYGEIMGNQLTSAAQPYIGKFFGKAAGAGEAAASDAAGSVSKIPSDLSNELSSLSDLAKQNGGQMSRADFMKSAGNATLGKNASFELTEAEQKAMKLLNDPAYQKALAQNSNAIPDDVKDVFWTAKQKTYLTAQNNAIGDTLNHMQANGVDVNSKTFLLNQTGSHARPNNPAWNLGSDVDHTADFGSPEFNQHYADSFDNHLQNLGTSSKAMNANVYGDGLNPGDAYTGPGGTKFVNNYNQNVGRQTMVRSQDGQVSITQETPQTTDSLLNMNKNDVASAQSNFKQAYNEGMQKGGDTNSLIQKGAKSVSRMGKTDVANTFNDTGKVINNPPPAVKASTLIKDHGLSVPDAMKQTGYTNQQQLLNDMNKYMSQH
jgi:hypothetical protein